MTAEEIRNRIDEAFRKYLVASDDASLDVIPKALTAGKLYEAYVLGLVAQKLTWEEGYKLRLVNSNYLALKSAPGPINRKFPRIELLSSGRCVAELWTDIEFLSLSYSRRLGSTQKGDYHELDIVVVEPGLQGRPSHDKIWLGIECKNTGYSKNLLKEILGIRRELSFLQGGRQTRFHNWPRRKVPADPPSCLLVYSTDKAVSEYSSPGNMFGIDFFYEALDV
jgi:hypothetical protein